MRILLLWFQTIVFRLELHKIPYWIIFQKFIIHMTLFLLLIPNLITKMCRLQYILLFLHTQRIFILKYLQKQPLLDLSNSIWLTLPPNDIQSVVFVKSDHISDVSNCLLARIECLFVIFLLRIESTETKTIGGQQIFHLKTLQRQLYLLVLVRRCYWILERMKIIFQIENNPLNISPAFLNHPQFMIHSRHIMQNTYNKIPLYSFATPCSILKYLLPLRQ